MSKRKYTHIKVLLPEIEAMLAQGMSHREIEEHFGLTGDRPVHNLLKRERRRKEKQLKGTIAKPKGRPRKDGQPPWQNPQREIERLRMENKLLRDFLSLTERK